MTICACEGQESKCVCRRAENGLEQNAGDPDWRSAHASLLALHIEKSSTYGTDDDPLANFTELAKATGARPERYVIERMMEKLSRALHMIDAGDGDAVAEYPDVASLALCAEALRKRQWAQNELSYLKDVTAQYEAARRCCK